jgi:hypothetical protein
MPIIATARWPLAAVAALGATMSFAEQPLGSSACSARSTDLVKPVVELYTSEGCNSCPPADRWLSSLVPQADVVALAFHVDYWDRLGWKDRFASPVYTQRQAQEQQRNGARFSYTPQVVVNGVDRKDWPAVASPALAKARPVAKVELALQRDGERFTAQIRSAAGAPQRLAAYWAVTEQGHITAVNAGENEGATLKHDFVVREYQPLPAWVAKAEAASKLHFTPAPSTPPGHARQVNFVVVDADTGRPLQALKLGC